MIHENSYSTEIFQLDFDIKNRKLKLLPGPPTLEGIPKTLVEKRNIGNNVFLLDDRKIVVYGGNEHNNGEYLDLNERTRDNKFQLFSSKEMTSNKDICTSPLPKLPSAVFKRLIINDYSD